MPPIKVGAHTVSDRGGSPVLLPASQSLESTAADDDPAAAASSGSGVFLMAQNLFTHVSQTRLGGVYERSTWIDTVALRCKSSC